MPYRLFITYNTNLTSEFGILESQMDSIMALVNQKPEAATMEQIQAHMGTFIPDILGYEIINSFYINKVSIDEQPFPVV